MPKPKTATGEKNLISKRLIELREKNHMSQRMLAHQLQLRGYDITFLFSHIHSKISVLIKSSRTSVRLGA